MISGRLIPPSVDEGKILRTFFEDVSYNLDALRGGLSFSDLASFRYRKFLLARNAEPAPLDLIVQWFTCGMTVPASSAGLLIPAPVMKTFEACGLLQREGEVLRPTAMISPFEGLFIASDLISKLDADASDLIVWPNSTTYQMLNAAIRRPCDAVLDLGCGTGALGVACTAHAKSVTGTDLNRRAEEFTAFNARLNGVESFECLTGDTYAPVAGRKFDQILCNPPFFLVPSTGLLYCENPMELDLFARSLMRQAPAHLSESGYFQMLCEWVELAGEPWQQRLREWADGIGCDVWVIRAYSMTPIAYGKERCEQRPGDRAAGDAAFLDWVEYYRTKGVEAVHGGLVTLRRRSGKNWVRFEEDPAMTLNQPVGNLILEGFASQDLMELADEELLQARLCVPERARLRQLLRREGSKWIQNRLTLTVPGTFGRELEMAPLVAEFTGQFDGLRSLGELILDLAQRVNADPQKVREECLDITRRLLERGFLGEIE